MALEEQRRIAKAALVALRATIDAPVAINVVTLLPELTTLTMEAAVLRFVGYKKPITCVALEAHQRLSIGVWQVDRASALVQSELLDGLPAQLGIDESAIDVTLSAPSEELSLTWAEYKALQSDYFIPFAAFVTETDQLSAVRTRLVVRVTRAHGGELRTVST